MPGSSHRRRVLVIDDEAAVRSLFAEMLEFLGYQVDQAADAIAGLALFDQRAFDLVVTDYVMPGLSGREVVEAIWQRRPGTGVIVMTGHAADSEVEQLQSEGVLVLMKPVGLPDLKAAVETALHQRTC